MHQLIKLDERGADAAANKIVNDNKQKRYEALMRKAYIIRLFAGFHKAAYGGNDKQYPWKPSSWAHKRDYWQSKRDEKLRKELDKGIMQYALRAGEAVLLAENSG